MRANTRSEKIVCYKYETQGCWHKNAATFFIFGVVKITPPQQYYVFIYYNYKSCYILQKWKRKDMCNFNHIYYFPNQF